MLQTAELECTQCGKKYIDPFSGTLTIGELGRVRAEVYGFEFDNFCNEECAKIYNKGEPTISAEEFATVNIDSLKNMEMV